MKTKIFSLLSKLFWIVGLNQLSVKYYIKSAMSKLSQRPHGLSTNFNIGDTLVVEDGVIKKGHDPEDVPQRTSVYDVN